MIPAVTLSRALSAHTLNAPPITNVVIVANFGKLAKRVDHLKVRATSPSLVMENRVIARQTVI